MLFNRLLPYILYFLILELQHIVPVKAKLSREIFYFLGIFYGGDYREEEGKSLGQGIAGVGGRPSSLKPHKTKTISRPKN
jgi:hypothetical protein